MKKRRERAGFVTVGSLISELSKNPKWAAGFKEARKQIAQDFYEPGDPQYERLMRGEGPNEERTPCDDDVQALHHSEESATEPATDQPEQAASTADPAQPGSLPRVH